MEAVGVVIQEVTYNITEEIHLPRHLQQRHQPQLVTFITSLIIIIISQVQAEVARAVVVAVGVEVQGLNIFLQIVSYMKTMMEKQLELWMSISAEHLVRLMFQRNRQKVSRDIFIYDALHQIIRIHGSSSSVQDQTVPSFWNLKGFSCRLETLL